MKCIFSLLNHKHAALEPISGVVGTVLSAFVYQEFVLKNIEEYFC